MATVKIKLDTRRAKADGTYNIIFKIRHQLKTYTINSGVSVFKSSWDYELSEVTIDHPNARLLNLKLIKQYYNIEKAVLILEHDFTIEKLRNVITGETPKQAETFKLFAQRLIEKMIDEGRAGNALVYQTAINRLVTFCGDLTFDKIDYKLLTEFIHHLKMAGLKTNSISNYLRSIRAIYNKAIKYKIAHRDNYPFYDIRIKSQRTANRAISKADITKLISLPLAENSPSKRALKYFMLSFYLRGISFTDMAYLKRSNIINGRIQNKRRKTHKNYSVKLFKPAEDIISTLHDSNNNYLLPILDNTIKEDSLEAKKVIKQWIKTTNKYLKRHSLELQSEINITTYSSRHSFATIAKHLGYSNEMIAEALGHEYGYRITNTYLGAFDTNKLDAMHYDVISFR